MDTFNQITGKISAYCKAEYLSMCPTAKSGEDSFQAGILQAWIAMLLLGAMTLEDVRKKLKLEVENEGV